MFGKMAAPNLLNDVITGINDSFFKIITSVDTEIRNKKTIALINEQQGGLQKSHRCKFNT